MTVEEAYQAYFPRIRAKCRRMMQSVGDAEDVAQETFVRLWQARLQDSHPRRVMVWVYRASTRLAIDQLRSRRAAAELSSEEILEGWPRPCRSRRSTQERSQRGAPCCPRAGDWTRKASPRTSWWR